MQYYYLDGLEKKGPYTKEELKGRNLNSETLVFSEGMDSWKPIKDIPELESYLFTIESITETNTELISEIVESTKLDEEKSKSIVEPTKIKIPSILFLFLSFGLCVVLAYFIANTQRQNDSKEINKKVDDIFKGNAAITDYNFDGSDGQLYDVYLSSFLGGIGEDKNVIRTKKRILAYKPISNFEDDKYAAFNNEKQKQWNLFKDFVQYYETAPFSGFDVLRLEKNSSTFSITKSWSGDMAYKVNATKHYDGYSSEFYSSPGYDLPTYRPSVGKCYEEAAKYLSSEKEDKSYEAGSFGKILSFNDIESIFFEIKQRYPKYSRLLNKIHVNHGESIGEGDVIDNSTITDATSANDASVYNSQWIVWYKSLKNTYAIEEKKGVFNKYWIIYSLIGIGLASLIFFILKYRKRIAFN